MLDSILIILISLAVIIWISVIIIALDKSDRNRRKPYPKNIDLEASSADLDIKNKIKDRINDLKQMNKDIFVEDIEMKVSVGDLQGAEHLLGEREQSFERFKELSEELNAVKLKIKKLTDRVANGDLNSDAFNKAHDELSKEHKNLEEKLWTLKNALFKDDYEKPF